MITFSDIVNGREEDGIDLARALLVMAHEVDPDVDVDSYMSRLDEMAHDIKSTLEEAADPMAIVEAINEYLYFEMGFRGNEEDYYNPKNSYLNEVINRKTGIPISLSILYKEIAGRLGIELDGVSLPGHFLLAGKGTLSGILIDPFDYGRLLSEEDCKDIIERIFGEDLEYSEEFLVPSGKRQILSRVLYNLKNIYLSTKNYTSALGVVNNLLILNPGAPEELRDRGVLYYTLECYANALEDLNSYLTAAPDADDAATIDSYIPALKEKVSKMS